tara:strand:- start:16015 stop:16656 length:642 start_codon:yes stop_codon:yes gene_type:complete
MKLKKPTIEVVDNFFPPDIANFVSDFCHTNASYKYGEADNEGNEHDPRKPTGLVHNVFFADKPDATIGDDKLIFDCITTAIGKHYPDYWDKYGIYRLYINVFAPNERAYFHNDADEGQDQNTFLYYPIHDWDYDIEESGWTEFYLDKKIIGVPPEWNTTCRFTSQILHRASPFKSYQRFSIAVKTARRDDINRWCEHPETINRKDSADLSVMD